MLNTLEEDLQVMYFYDTLLGKWKMYMHSKWTWFVKAIKFLYLTKRWEMDQEENLQAMCFHQSGSKQESPQTFLN
jgi:hypothetical protein